MRHSDIYTGKGDFGQSRNIEGLLLNKDNDTFLCLAKFDTLHAAIGVALKNCRSQDIVVDFNFIHQHLYSIMAELGYTETHKLNSFLISSSALKECDFEQLRQCFVAYAGVLDDQGGIIKGWTDYGGFNVSQSSSFFDFATTVCREAEIYMYKRGKPRDLLCKYINLLSKVLFILARNV